MNSEMAALSISRSVTRKSSSRLAPRAPSSSPSPNWVDASEFLVMNGDSFLEIDLASFIQFHRDRHALVSMAVVRVEDSSRYGTVQVDGNQKVIGFVEKAGSTGPGWVNAGVYVFSPEVLRLHSARPLESGEGCVSPSPRQRRLRAGAQRNVHRHRDSRRLRKSATALRSLVSSSIVLNLLECEANKGVSVP